MKKVLSITAILLVASFVCMGSASALTFDYSNDPIPDVSIANDSSVPDANNWYKVLLPSWYDSKYVTKFTIDMYGYADDSTYTIDIWRKLGGTSATAAKIVGFDVSNSSRAFILEMNLMDNNLYRNYKKSDGTWTGLVDTGKDLLNISLASFDPIDDFLIGYACHFKLDKTTIHIEQNTPVPEPATVMLLGLGLAGVAIARRKFRK